MNQLIKLTDLFQTKELSFLRPTDNLYFNGACHTPISLQALEALQNYHELFGVCSSRGDLGSVSENLNELVEETRHLILQNLKLNASEWDVVFCSNATQGLNMAINIMSHYLRQEHYNFEVSIHPLSHNSVYIPAKKVIRKYKVPELELDLNMKPEYKEKVKTHRLLCMPYIDNAIGYNHYQYFYRNIDNRKFLGKPKNHEHIVLDACQAGTTIFNPIKGDLPLLNPCGAIAFSAHKMHSEHLGILVIRKKYLEKIDLFEVDGVYAGGGTLLNISSTGKPLLHHSHIGLEAGLLNDGAILALGAWLKFLSKYKHNLLAEMQEFTCKLKKGVQDFCVPELEILSIPHYRKIKENGLTNNNIILLQPRSGGFPSSELGARLFEKKVECRVGKFCVDAGLAKFGIESAVRLSLDWSINNDKEYREIDKLISILAEIADEMHKDRTSI